MANQQDAQRSQSLEQSRGRGSQSMGRRSDSSAQMRRSQHDQPAVGPFTLMRRISEDMDRFFTDFFGPSIFRWGEMPDLLTRATESAFWPEVEVRQDGDKLIIQADVPGLKREDLNVELIDDELRISGERRSESERSERGYYRSERSYGSFARSIPLPEGVKPESASATFENGVLRIEMEAPNGAEQRHRRRIEVREGSPH